MPLFGALELASVAARLPRLKDLDTEAWTLPRVEIIQLAWEANDETQALLPRAMHPAIPPYVTVVVTCCPESPVGPFALAQLRLMGRAGAHPRGYVLGAVATTAEAARALGERWGFPAAVGAVTVKRYHDQVTVSVARAGAPVLEAAVVNPEVISGGDIQYIHSVTLAQVPDNGRAEPRLLQVDSHYTFQKAERGRPKLVRLDAAAWNAPGLEPRAPIAASVTTCDTDLPQIRFVMDPERPVIQGTRKIR